MKTLLTFQDLPTSLTADFTSLLKSAVRLPHNLFPPFPKLAKRISAKCSGAICWLNFKLNNSVPSKSFFKPVNIH